MAIPQVFSVVSPKGFYTGAGTEILSIQLRGTEEIKAKLKMLSDIGKMKASEQAMRAGANVIRDSIKQKAPLGKFETVTKKGQRFPVGSLKKSIIVKKKTDKFDRTNIKFQVGPDKDKAYYAHMVEFGTSLHKIPKKAGWPSGKLLKFKRTSGGAYRPEFISEQTYTEAFTGGSRKVSGAYVFIGGVEVTAKPHPFVRPGFDSSRVKATTIIQERLLKAIDKIAKKEAT